MCSDWRHGIDNPNRFFLRAAIKIIYYYLFTQNEEKMM